MTKDVVRPLDELRKELARQDEEWARVKQQLRALNELGDVTLAVPNEALEAFETLESKTATPIGAFAGRV